jgi:pectate lyase
MKKYILPIFTTCSCKALVALLVFTAVLLDARGALLFYDGFDYTVGEDLGDPSSALYWENGKSQLTIAAGSLEYSGLQTSAGNRVNATATTPNLDSVRTKSGVWTSQTNGTLYISFLLRVQSTNSIGATGEGTSVLTLSATANNTQLLGVNLLSSGGVRLGVLKYPSGSSPVSSSAFFGSGLGNNLSTDGSTTYLIVAKYEWVAGTLNDVVTLWINPTTLGGSEDPNNRVTTSAGADGTGTAGRITLSRGANVNIDELRIGQNWAEVTPTGAPVVTPQPYITHGFFIPAGFVLQGTNGTPSGTYQVLISTNTASVNAWNAISTNAFDGSGNFASTNPVPNDASQSFYRLLLGGSLPAGPVAPSINTQPSSLSVVIGQNAQFNVAASGTAPLAYQWYFNSVPISGANANSYTRTSAGTNDAGGYQVIITNTIGAVTSAVATLTVVPAPAAGVPDGYATIGSGTTGGAGGPTVTVTNFADFEFYVDNDTGPYIVLVQGTINLGSSNVRVRDNKTIIGIGTNATLVGDLKVAGNNNVIIRNLTFTNPNGAGDNDGLTLQECLNVWVDHCTFVDCADGSLDITHAADWVTVSWCRFYYTDTGNDHRFSNLIGHSDNNAGEDAGKLHVTFHHNWWGQLVHERMPRVRFGRVHVYNNYYNSPGNNNCIRAARDSELLVQNNYFDSVKNVWELYRTEGVDGKVSASGNIEVNTTWTTGDDSSSIQIPGTDVLSAGGNGLNPVPYAVVLDPAANVPAMVTNSAGAGKGPFAP